MPHDVRSPHIFVDGPGHTASGDAVMDNLDALWAAIDTLQSPGTIKISGEGGPGTGWLNCDGAAVSRTTYAGLFTAIGLSFGAGDGSTTFNVPNLKGKVPVGKDAAQTEFDTLGETGGAKTVTLSSGEMPAHTHGPGGAATGFAAAVAVGAEIIFPGGGTYGAITRSVTASTGSGGAHNNLAPYQTVNFFIKT